MKKKLLTLLSLIVMFFSSFSLAGCSFGEWFAPDLKTPVVVLDTENKTINWNAVENAEKYNVYLNSTLYETIAATADINYCNFSTAVNDDVKIYKLYVIAYAEGYNDSLKSNVVTYLNSTEGVSVESQMLVDNSLPNIVENITVNDKVLSWNEVSGATEYYVSLYTNALGLRYFETDVNGFNFDEYVDDDEVVLFRVGVESGENQVTLSKQIYYNTNQTNNSYTSKYFYIDGFVGDYNITSQAELNKLIYYGFIYKVDKLDVYFSDAYMQQLINTYGSVGYSYGQRIELYHLSKAVEKACYSFTETCDYDTNLSNITASNPSKNDFTINFTFAGGKQPVNTTNKVNDKNVLNINEIDDTKPPIL